MDSLDWFKDRVKRPKAVVDLSQIGDLKGIRPHADGVEIGAMTTLTEVATHPLLQSQYAILPGGTQGSDAADSASGHPGRQHQPGYAVLVLPQRYAVLSGWRQHLLRRYTNGHEP